MNSSYAQVSQYSFDELAGIYNETRVDYIVPMPMNGKRMADYVHDYDIDLHGSTVSLNAKHSPNGIIMLGLRDDRSWITRLGILPNQRGHRIGQGLMESSIEQSRQRAVRRVQLEVITGNEPAYCLFQKLGFVDVRELLVIRRPPGSPNSDCQLEGATITPMPAADIAVCLTQREPDIAWTEESASLRHISEIKGFCAVLPSGETGWLIYQLTPFQLTHVIIAPDASDEMMRTLICHLHHQHPRHDTKIENLPRLHPAWPVFHAAGYLEVFSRIEMYLHL